MLYNPTGGKIRSDSAGDGHFGARRGKRIHAGVDLVAVPGQTVQSPIVGVVLRYARPYADAPKWTGLVIQGEHLEAKLFYLTPAVTIGQEVVRGTYIGVAQDISEKYPGSTPHIHMEVYIRSGTALDKHGHWFDDTVRINPMLLFE